MQTKLDELLVVVEKEIVMAEKNYRQAKNSAWEVAASAALSPSQAGDRFHSQSAADLAKQRLDSLKKLEAEVKSGFVRYVKKEGEELFVVKNVAHVSGVKLVSAESPIGKGLLNNVE